MLWEEAQPQLQPWGLWTLKTPHLCPSCRGLWHHRFSSPGGLRPLPRDLAWQQLPSRGSLGRGARSSVTRWLGLPTKSHPPHDRHPQRLPDLSWVPRSVRCRVGLLGPPPHTYQPPPTPMCSQLFPTLLRNTASDPLSRGTCRGAARVAARALRTAHGAVMEARV